MVEDRGKAASDRGVEADVHDEVSFHLAMQVRELELRGWSSEAAREEAVRRFGDVAEYERRLSGIDRRKARRQGRLAIVRDLRHDLRFAFRNMRRRPVFSLVAIGTLALGMGANAAVFALVDGALLRPLPFADAGEIVVVGDVQNGETGLPASVPEFDDWSASGDFSRSMVAFSSMDLTLTGDGPARQLAVGQVLGDLTGTLGLAPVIGRSFEAAEVRDGARVLLLDENYWSARYERNPDVLGTTLRLNGESYTVVGVLPSAVGVVRPGEPPGAWAPMRRESFMSRGLHFLRVLARVERGVSPSVAGARAEALASRLRESGATTHGVGLLPFREALVADARATVLVLFGAVAVMLLIVCANVANLVFAQSMDRAREFGIRVAIGAGARRLARQVLTESLVLGLIGGAAGIGVAAGAARLVDRVAPSVAALASSPFDARMFGFTFGTSLLVALVVGLWPALRLARSDVGQTLRETGEGRSLGSRSGIRRRRFLAGLELALSVVLVASSGLLLRSMINLLGQETGFDAENVLTFSLLLPPASYPEGRQVVFLDRLLESVRAIPRVESAGAGSHLPLGGSDTNGGFEIVGRESPDGEALRIRKRIVSPGYFESLRVPLLSGRLFDERDRAGGEEVVIITDAVARRWWPGENAVGRRVRFLWGSSGEQVIIGVVGDVRHDGLDQPMDGMMFRPAGQFPQAGFNVVVRTIGDPLQFIDPIRSVVREIDPDVPVVSLQPMTSIVSASVAPRRTTTTLFSAFAVLAIVLATLGVYAIAAQAVAQRTGEFGLRLAMGAGRGDVMRLVLRTELPVIVLGSLAGLGTAVVATRVLRTSLFGIAPGDPLTLGASIAVLAAVAVAAILVPARRASRMDPLTALRRV